MGTWWVEWAEWLGWRVHKGGRKGDARISIQIATTTRESPRLLAGLDWLGNPRAIFVDWRVARRPFGAQSRLAPPSPAVRCFHPPSPSPSPSLAMASETRDACPTTGVGSDTEHPDSVDRNAARALNPFARPSSDKTDRWYVRCWRSGGSGGGGGAHRQPSAVASTIHDQHHVAHRHHQYHHRH